MWGLAISFEGVLCIEWVHPLKFIYLNPNPQLYGDGIRKWSVWELMRVEATEIELVLL